MKYSVTDGFSRPAASVYWVRSLDPMQRKLTCFTNARTVGPRLASRSSLRPEDLVDAHGRREFADGLDDLHHLAFKGDHG